jgi:hypothetical protein
VRLTVTPNDVVFYRPFETYERSLRDARGDIEALFVEETAAELIERAIRGPAASSDGATNAGKIELFSGRTGAKLRTITSTTEGENLGFDAVGVGDVDRDRRIDLLASAAEGDTVYMIAGTGRRGPRW